MDNPSYIVDYPFLLICKITIQNKHDLYQDGKGNLDLYGV